MVVVQDVPPYNFHGSLDDSLQNLRKVVPVPPRRDYVKYMDNIGKLLRYEARLVTLVDNSPWMQFFLPDCFHGPFLLSYSVPVLFFSFFFSFLFRALD